MILIDSFSSFETLLSSLICQQGALGYEIDRPLYLRP